MPGHPAHSAQQSAPPPPARPAVHPVHPSGDPAGDVVRWAAFSCVLVPVVLVVYGTSFGGAAVATLGLVAVTAVCRVLLRRSELTAARVTAAEQSAAGHRGRHSRTGSGAHRGCHGGGGTPGRGPGGGPNPHG
ncbi:hypothetical protein [Streptomyces sp. NPDC101132]|uniref:hypothetical protein n=1 Tax=Streptomyces sp. NPDC101132 TaxID=3366110 RepID=UPI003821607F